MFQMHITMTISPFAARKKLYVYNTNDSITNALANACAILLGNEM